MRRNNLLHRSILRELFVNPPPIANTGNIARDLMAAERTFLSWARTGLGFLGVGTGVFGAYYSTNRKAVVHEIAGGAVKLPEPRQDIVPACMALWGNGIILLAFALQRYSYTSDCIKANIFPVGKRGVIWVVICTACASTFALLDIVRCANVTSSQEPLRLLGQQTSGSID